MTKRSKEYWNSYDWKGFQLDPNQDLPEAWAPMSHIKLKFICACTRPCTISVREVIQGGTTTCGKCSFQPKELWLAQTYGSLHLVDTPDLPTEWGKASNLKVRWLCDCARDHWASFKMVNCGHSTSCGRCTYKPKDYWLEQRWGKLVLDRNQELPEEWGASSNKKFLTLCDCGKETRQQFTHLSSGQSSSCGRCSYHPKSYWLTQQWGTLRLSPNQVLPDSWGHGHYTKLLFSCDCGREFEKMFNNVTKSSHSSDTQTCGKCYYLPKTYWLQQVWGSLHLDPTQELPEEWPVSSAAKRRFTCACGETKSTVFNYVTSGGTQSCGCIKKGMGVNSPATLILKFITPMAPDVVGSHWFKTDKGNREYDIYIPSKKLAIEYHGLQWHTDNRIGKKDWEKYVWSKQSGIRLIQIYGDEWESKQEIIKAQLKDELVSLKKQRISPIFSVELGTTSPEARAFLDANHYLGAASGCVTVVARYREAIVGVWVFMKRETGTVLWHRACWNRAYKSWNPHEKALKLALPALREMGFTRMVTFSDNRFHTGNLYEKLGFTFEEELKPDYSYTDGNLKRKSKYALRVPAGTNEVQAAAAKGWYRIYDSGKRRYSLSLV